MAIMKRWKERPSTLTPYPPPTPDGSRHWLAVKIVATAVADVFRDTPLRAHYQTRDSNRPQAHTHTQGPTLVVRVEWRQVWCR